MEEGDTITAKKRRGKKGFMIDSFLVLKAAS
jgi:hypothetical protein